MDHVDHTLTLVLDATGENRNQVEPLENPKP